MERAAKLRILVASNRRSLDEIDTALEALEGGSSERTHSSTLQRGFHTIRHEARSLRLRLLEEAAGAAERIVDRSRERGVGLPLDVLQQASAEIRRATETVAAGERHAFDRKLLESLRQAEHDAVADP